MVDWFMIVDSCCIKVLTRSSSSVGFFKLCIVQWDKLFHNNATIFLLLFQCSCSLWSIWMYFILEGLVRWVFSWLTITIKYISIVMVTNKFGYSDIRGYQQLITFKHVQAQDCIEIRTPWKRDWKMRFWSCRHLFFKMGGNSFKYVGRLRIT